MIWWLLPYKWKQQWQTRSDLGLRKTLVRKLIKRFKKKPPENWTVGMGSMRAKGSNYISTCNYTIFSFLPKFLFSQFKQFANALFLALVVIQCFPDLSPFGLRTTAGPLGFIICCSFVREVYEEIRRRVRDRRINHQLVWAHTAKGWKTIKWCNIHVGQAIKVQGGEALPADVLFLSSSEAGGIGYVETANLDGESSLKVRQALAQTMALRTDEAVESLWNMGGRIVCDLPNKDIHKFTGYLELKEKVAISNANMLYRGARLKNTDFIYGITVYTGKDTKLRMNNTNRTLKRSKLAKMTNSVMLAQFGMAILLALSAALYQRVFPNLVYHSFVFEDIKLDSLGFIFLGCLMLLVGLIPISLYVTLEMIQVVQGLFIRGDPDMYDESKDLGADVKTFSLNSELGEVRYVMSDKTGTLTQNNMRFRQCSVAGVKYANRRNRAQETFKTDCLLKDLETDKWKTADQIRQFLISCAVCHTVTTDKHSMDKDRPLYHATSPDETALVRMAADAGFVFHSRQHSTNRIVVKMGETLTSFELLHLFEFNSERKRMSVVVRTDDGQIRIYVKGADVMILPRLKETSSKLMKRIRRHLHGFASQGYRTLAFGMRAMSAEEWKAIEPRIAAAKVDLVKQQELFSQLAEEVERDLDLLGISAIEDRLQEHVPQTIERMLNSGMRVWVLTGDKLETAVNIGNSCHLLNHRTPMFVLCSPVEEETRSSLLDMIASLENKLHERLQLALIIDAVCLDFLLNDQYLRLQFLRLALACSAVICCRCTPLQKAAVTRLVKRNADGCVLAVGDGANDVAMIQEADVGVGIAGEEGMQAALAADYSIAQFRFLDNLLFVHGTLSLFRTSKCILYSIYKNVLETTCLFLFTFFNGRSDQPMADQWTIVRYNIFFTSWPAIIMGTFDRPTTVDFFKKYSQMYQLYQNELSMRGQMGWFGMGLAHGLILFCIGHMSWGAGAPLSPYSGRDDHIYLFGITMYILIVTIANAKCVLESSSVTPLAVGVAIGSILVYYLMLIWDAYAYLFMPGQTMQMAELLWHTPWPQTALVLILAMAATFLSDITFKVIRYSIYKDARDVILWQEGVRGLNFEILYKPLFKIVDSVGMLGHLENVDNGNGFAFAQDDGEAVTQLQLITGFGGEGAADLETRRDELLTDDEVSPSRRSGSSRTPVPDVEPIESSQLASSLD